MMHSRPWPLFRALPIFCFLTACLLLPVAAQELRQDPEQRTIANPFYKNPKWRLWYENPEPVEVNAGRDNIFKAAPPPVEERRYPVITDEWIKSASGAPPFQKVDDPGKIAGAWDDAYMSLDNYHSNLGNPRGMFINAGKMRYEHAPQVLHALGVNFSSQSYARRGRHIVDDTQMLIFTEKNFTFANIVRATPAHASYEDKDPVMVADKYDGLYGHSFQSVGQSSSEKYALEKMLKAGACMDRDVKNTLKKHGLYALALMTIFKQALPYADTDGKPLPYQHELRHRPAYSSSGNLGHPHYAPANPYYHSYNDDLHLYSMCRIANAMKTTPPVAIIDIDDIQLENSDRPTSATEAIVSRCLTSVRVWGQSGETIRVRVNLRNCYTIDQRPFQVHGDVLYPEQKNITMMPKEHGIIEVVAKHDPKLPKHRQTVMFFATRSDCPVPSNPVFLNFYWPEQGEVPNWINHRPRKGEEHIAKAMRLPVNENKRPQLVDMDMDTTIHATSGETISLPLKATDPEGYPIATYRWLGEKGAIENNTFRFTCPDDSAGKIFPFHFIFSDQTGAYSGMRLKVLVSEQKTELPDSWQQTVLGGSTNPGSARIDGDKIILTGHGKNDNDGAYVFKSVEGDFDVTCPMTRFETGEGENAWGIMARESLKNFSRRIAVEMIQDQNKTLAQCIVRPGNANWGSNKTTAIMTDDPQWLRLSRNGNRFTAYVSSDAKTWEFLNSEKIELPDTILLGLFVRGQHQASIETAIDDSNDTPLPILQFEGKAIKHKPRRWEGEIKISLLNHNPEGTRLEIDGKEYPTSQPVTLNMPGEYPMTISMHSDQTVQTRVIVEPEKDQDKKEK